MCKCRICGNMSNNKLFLVKERMINKGDVFEYFLCSSCGTLQMKSFEISNMGEYYSEKYYSFDENQLLNNKSQIKNIFHKVLFFTLLYIPMPRRVTEKCWERFAHYMYLKGTRVTNDSKILDVGCGSGKWLNFLSCIGFKKLYGIDKYCKCPLDGFEFNTTDIMHYSQNDFDVITFHHSFEHMENPIEVLARVKELLKSTGICIIRIPVCGGEMWEEYQTNWYQIDAPRHYFLYSQKGFEVLCKKSGFSVERIIYDSMPTQYIISEYYKDTDLSLDEICSRISVQENEKFRKRTQIANRNQEGDMAIFYIRVN